MIGYSIFFHNSRSALLAEFGNLRNEMLDNWQLNFEYKKNKLESSLL